MNEVPTQQRSARAARGRAETPLLACVPSGSCWQEASCLECELPDFFVDIELAPLRSHVCRGFRFVDRRCNTVNMEDSGKCQTAEPGTDDRDWSIHPDPFVV
jgi:hypothetical protein